MMHQRIYETEWLGGEAVICMEYAESVTNITIS